MTRDENPTPFDDLDAYVALPRLVGLLLSPGGTGSSRGRDARPERRRTSARCGRSTRAGVRPARRLTRSAKGETPAAFLPDGGLLFTSAGPGAQGEKAGRGRRAGRALAAAGRRRGGPRGGLARPVASRARWWRRTREPSSSPPDDAGALERRRRREAPQGPQGPEGLAILHEGYPVRYWDADLGPDQVRLLAGRVPAEPAPGTTTRRRPDRAHGPHPAPGRALDEAQTA